MQADSTFAAHPIVRQALIRNILMLLPALLFLLVLFIYPLAGMVARSLYGDGLTLENYHRIFTGDIYFLVIGLTFRIAAIVTLICIVVGYPLAYFMANVADRIARLLLIVVIVPYFTSVIVRTYAWMILLGKDGVINQYLTATGIAKEPVSMLYNEAGILIGMSYVLLPYMVLSLFTVMRRIDHRLMLAAHSLGASRTQAFLRVFLPLSLPGLGAGVLLVFILSLGFYITPALMGGPSDMMIGMLIQREVDVSVDWPFASALATVLLAVTMAVFFLCARFVRIDRIFQVQG
jgi:putative spermidine/putrescine transport system permease protein